MEKYEILSPAGDLKNFYTAIKSGADAVYFGLPKFNARMRAENITLENLSEVISFAHLKGVKCYLTLNTILTNKEIHEACDMVKKCLECGVDAFIIQDLGLASALKKAFPDIVLHASTQMGVHNVRGARVLKNLGFSRVVLSRECTIEDIIDIKNNVDIELEVFIQGAMCVGFSGNCYLSSIKCNFSGNRGECKQLCRLPYILTDNNKTTKGYAMSIRDNCMLEHISKLMEIGVISFKIEGRLRHEGYVAVTTSTYRKVIDSIKNNKNIDYKQLKDGLYKTFSRGEFIDGYNTHNNVIEVKTNNHIGLPIGEVISCTRFKDLYKISINTKTKLHTGDGLKFITNEIISMGVGNIENDGKNQIVFGKNYIKNGTKVYLSLDSEFENSVPDFSRRRKVDITFEGFVGNCSRLILKSGEHFAEVMGSICEVAKTKSIDRQTVIKQITKWDNNIWELGSIDITLEDIYIPLSELNEMRRQALTILEDKILNTYKSPITYNPLVDNFKTPNLPYDNIILVDETFKDYKILILKFWWALTDSNRGPIGYEPTALTN